MYHQCLNCGSIYKRGSLDVLQGCRECGKSRFSFTRNPVPKEELMEMKRVSNDDLGILMKEIQDHNMQVSELSKAERELVGKKSAGWVKVRMEDETKGETEGEDERDTGRDTGRGTEEGEENIPLRDNRAERERFSDVDLGEIPSGLGISGEDVLDTYLRGEGGKSRPARGERRAGEKTERKVGRKRMPGDPVWAGDVKMETSSIEVVRETEEGVYEIDLGRMMDSMLNKLPVVMMEKGVYLINLGSDRRDTP